MLNKLIEIPYSENWDAKFSDLNFTFMLDLVFELILNNICTKPHIIDYI